MRHWSLVLCLLLVGISMLGCSRRKENAGPPPAYDANYDAPVSVLEYRANPDAAGNQAAISDRYSKRNKAASIADAATAAPAEADETNDAADTSTEAADTDANATDTEATETNTEAADTDPADANTDADAADIEEKDESEDGDSESQAYRNKYGATPKPSYH